jgi:transposase
MIRAHKIRLNTTSDQANYLARVAGINRLATLSDGRRFESQKPLRMSLKQLAHASRALSQKQKCHTLHPNLTLVDRIFVCMNLACGYKANRDYNASLNPKQEARLLASPGYNSRPSSVLARSGCKTACRGAARL